MDEKQQHQLFGLIYHGKSGTHTPMPPKKKAQKRKGNDDDSPDRIAIVDTEKCKPRKYLNTRWN